MPLLHLIILSVIQGVTEFLPVSSSGHLALYPLLSGGVDQGLAIDVAVHVGSLLAVMLYFRNDVAALMRGGLRLLVADWRAEEAKLVLLLALATVPVVLAGLALTLLGWTDALRSVAVIGWATLIGGVILWLADSRGATRREAAGWTLRDALLIGLAQALALIPGSSRSGVTMTAARALGFARVDAARLSMLMSIPTIIAAGVLTARDLAGEENAALGLDALIAAGLSFAAAYAALALMMRMLRSWTMTPFAIYRLILGAALLAYAYF